MKDGGFSDGMFTFCGILGPGIEGGGLSCGTLGGGGGESMVFRPCSWEIWGMQCDCWLSSKRGNDAISSLH